ncbi:MAG: hypothetical protein Q9P90_03515 [candidate division KSB1 bacterium]|nr:hypothetical protein [candidate division KSB1 bacterium]
MRLFSKFILLAVIAPGLWLWSGCERELPVSPMVNTATFLSVRYGTQFGECFGYCYTTLSLDSAGISFQQGSWHPQNFPPRRIYAELDTAAWNALQQTFDPQAFSRLDTVIGCPDCADGGAEWLEIHTGAGVKRVTFEYGDSLAGLNLFLNTIRTLHKSFEETMRQILNTKGWQFFPQVLITSQPWDSLLLAEYRVTDAAVQNDTLALTVEHGGGCAPHFYALYMSPDAFAESLPVQANLYLYHEANGDQCKALLTRTLVVSLSPIRALYRQFYGRDEEIVLNIFEWDRGQVSRATAVSMPKRP